MTRLLIIALVAGGCWTLAAWFFWALVRVGTRNDPPEYDEPDDGVQPPDPYPASLTPPRTDGTVPTTLTMTSGGSVTFVPGWRDGDALN